MNRLAIALALAAALGTGCNPWPETPPAAKLKDGELPLPPDYRSWPTFLTDVPRPDVKQVREIYVNPTGSRAVNGHSFPDGTVLVMENYAVRENPDGGPTSGPDGKLLKGPLQRVFVMGKHAGWGDTAPRGLKTGDWIYATYDATGKPAPDSLEACRACHLPLAAKDFVQRYDEYFATRR